MRFADTNILLYAVSRDPDEQDKAVRANQILDARDVGLSVQVLQEFYVQATRASRPDPLTGPQALALVESFVSRSQRRRQSSCSPQPRPASASGFPTGTQQSSKQAGCSDAR